MVLNGQKICEIAYFVLFEKIKNLEENISSNIKLTKRNIEIDNNGKIDESTKLLLLNELKYKNKYQNKIFLNLKGKKKLRFFLPDPI